MTIPTLSQFNANPELLKDLLIKKNLTAIEYPASDWQSLVPSETAFAFCSGATRLANLTVYSIQSDTIFYSVIFPQYTDSQLRQLTTLLDFVKTILKENPSTYEPHNKFMFINNCLSVANKKISLSYKNNQIFLSQYSTVRLVENIPLPDLSFERVYTTILNDFNTKISVMLDAKLSTINTASMMHLQEETNADFIERTHKNRIVKALDVTDFKQHVEGLNLPVQYIAYETMNKSLNNNSIYIMNNYNKVRFAVGIQKINKLKMMLSPLMSKDDIQELIQLLSIAQFYSSLLHPAFNNNCIEISQCYIFNLSKENLLTNPTYMEISIGIFDFDISDKIKVDNYMEDMEKHFTTINEAYKYLFEYIQEDIFQRLNTDSKNISNKDLLVIDMLTC